MNDSFFSKIDRQHVVACYHDWSMIAADFDTPLTEVLEIMPTEKLKPVQVKAGITRVKLMGMEYRQIDRLAPYNEFGVLIPVESIEDDHDHGTPIYYIFRLPVTTQEACDGGVTIYGYPKFVAQINFDQETEALRCRVGAGGEDIVSFEVQPQSTTHQTMDFCTYSVRDNKLLKTLIQAEGQSGMTENERGARYIWGNHPIATELRNLKMSEFPAECQYAPKLQGVLHFPEEVISL